jgi:hypothetical protein
MRERDPRREHASLWSIDEELVQLPMSKWGETTSYSARIKARIDHTRYHARKELYPLSRAEGGKVDLTARAYVLLPSITFTVDLFDNVSPSGAVGNVVSSQWEGMKHHEIARLRSMYYEEEKSLAIWEIDDFDRLDSASRIILWQGFEQFLLRHYPEARRIYTDDSEPGENTADNQRLLEALGYRSVGTPRIFTKALATPQIQR